MAPAAYGPDRVPAFFISQEERGRKTQGRMVDVDTVVIGSGMGGLSAATALARAGQKVVVCEQHYTPGGWSHSFRAGGHSFSPGVHYIGEMQEGGATRRTLEGLGLGEWLSFFELNRKGYDHVRGGDVRFDFPSGRQALEAALCEKFPADAEGITKFVRLSNRICDEMETLSSVSGFLEMLAIPYRTRHLGRYGLFSLERILGGLVRDPVARGVLSIQCGNHGMMPSLAPFALHAGVTGHYREGGWYPRGGGRALSSAFSRALNAAGGELRLGARVDRILVESRKALGVRLADGVEIRARHVISNADPHVTYRRLMRGERLPAGLSRKLDNMRWSTSAVSLFFSVKADVRALGLDSGNYWLSSGVDSQAAYEAMARPDVLERAELPGLFLSVTSLKDPTSFDGRHHTCEAFTLAPFESFARFGGVRPGGRSVGYGEFKTMVAGKMLAAIEKQLPGLTKQVVFQDVGSPLTNEYYCEATRGSCYGTEKSLWQLGPFAWRVATPFTGLTLCGASTLAHGVSGAAVSGLAAAGQVIGCRPDDLLKTGQPRIETHLADDQTDWPKELRELV